MSNKEKFSASSNSTDMLILIGHIPPSFHTPDLRNFFSYSIEKESFVCFNYRHRPHSSHEFNLCICKIKANKFDEITKLYDKKNWIDSMGKLLAKKCSVIKVKITSEAQNSVDSDQLNIEDINNLLEFKKIPHWMPNGNVGTPTKIFIKYINQCIMPQSLIAKLGLNLKAYKTHKKKKYSTVEYKYDEDEYEYEENSNNFEDFAFIATTANGHKISENIDDEKLIKEINYSKQESDKEKILKENAQHSEEEDDDLEDWERHESLHDDVTKQDRTSPYFFENEIELKWEKGGSGLVFYTDDNFWKDYENKDFDAETADDLDVDINMYYEANSGDKDDQDILEMRRENMLRSGANEELFDDKKIQSKLNPFNKPKSSKQKAKKIGSFEKYTKGLGRRILEKQGWKEGNPVGNPKRSGLKEALDASDGKLPKDKTGLGYYGVKIDREAVIERQRINREIERRSQPYYIASKYDFDSSKPDTLLRRFDSTMKYRQPKQQAKQDL